MPERRWLRLQAAGRSAAIVGDGINDGPTLASGRPDLALGSRTEVAICAADMIVLRDDLLAVPRAIMLPGHIRLHPP